MYRVIQMWARSPVQNRASRSRIGRSSTHCVLKCVVARPAAPDWDRRRAKGKDIVGLQNSPLSSAIVSMAGAAFRPSARIGGHSSRFDRHDQQRLPAAADTERGCASTSLARTVRRREHYRRLHRRYMVVPGNLKDDLPAIGSYVHHDGLTVGPIGSEQGTPLARRRSTTPPGR